MYLFKWIFWCYCHFIISIYLKFYSWRDSFPQFFADVLDRSDLGVGREVTLEEKSGTSSLK